MKRHVHCVAMIISSNENVVRECVGDRDLVEELQFTVEEDIVG